MMLRVEYVLSLWFLATVDAAKFFFGPTLPGADGSSGEFDVYWNVPTFMCHKYDLRFENVRDFGIHQNERDQFAGDKIAILYDPGLFPALIKGERTSKRNGGVPQKGNLTVHLEAFRQSVIDRISDESFDGIAVIDFESWRPIFRQNWASLAPYRDLSISIVREEHPFWDQRSVEQEAIKEFESAGRLFMEETLKLAIELRPFANWSYYAYPYCFNETPNQRTSTCDSKIPRENDRLSWLFELEKVLLPSMYLRLELDKRQRLGLIEGRIKEALRISKKSKQKIIPYFWYKYQDQRNVFLSSEDMEMSIRKILETGADGVIIWGSSEDVNTKSKCQKLSDYLKKVLGPIVLRFTRTGRISEIVENHNSSTETNEVDRPLDKRHEGLEE